MKLAAVAEKLVQEVRKLIEEDIIISDPKGIIIASTDQTRIGSFHEGAIHALESGKKLIINQQDEKKWRGVKAGINLPVFFQQEAVCVIGITGDPRQVSPYGELLKKMTEMFFQESYHREQEESQSRLMEFFIFEWYQLQKFDEPFLQKAKLLGIDVTVDRIVILGEFLTDGVIEPSVWRDLQNKVTKRNDEDIMVRWGRNQFVLLMAAERFGSRHKQTETLHNLKRKLENQWGYRVSMGVGPRCRGCDFKKSFSRAERSLKNAVPHAEIIFDEDLKLEVLLDEIRPEMKEDFLSRTIEELIPYEELVETLSMYFSCNLSMKETAELLHIHINTLHYRLKRIEELTNLNPRKLVDRVTLYLALRLLDEHTI